MPRPRKSSRQTQVVLAAFCQAPHAWCYGYDLCKRTGLKSGTLYPLLIRLHDQGVLEAEWHPSAGVGRPPRHAYRLTRPGLALAREVIAKASQADDRRPSYA